MDTAARAGFHAPVSSLPRQRGMPFRRVAIAQIVVAWSILGLLDQALHPWSVPKPGPLIAALGLLLAVVFSIRISEAAQAWALNPGRSVSEIAPFLRLVQLVGGFLFAVIALQMLF